MESASKKMLSAGFGTLQDTSQGCREGKNELVSLNEAGASALMNPVETISMKS